MGSKKPKPQPALPEATTESARTGDTETWIERETEATTSNLREARELRIQLLNEFNAGNDVSTSLDAIDKEIADHERKLTRLADARKLRDAQNSKEAIKARREAVRKNLQEALNDARTLGEEVKSLLHVFAEIGSRLAAIAAAKDSIRARVSDAIRDEGPAQRVEEQHRAVQNLVERLTLPSHLANRIWTSGLGRVGSHIDVGAFSIRGFAVPSDPDEVIANTVEHLRAIGEKALREAA